MIKENTILANLHSNSSAIDLPDTEPINKGKWLIHGNKPNTVGIVSHQT